MRMLFALAALALLAGCALAGSAGMYVPAVVVNGGGEMVWISVQAEEGSGRVYTATAPLIGTDTQTSERTAAAVGAGVLGIYTTDYDFFLTMNASNTKEVDGPSAGAAMTLLTIAALNGSSVRRDMTITGTIEEDGSIGPVGGVVKKVEAASGMGIHVVLIPRGSDVSDKIIIAALKRRLNVTIVEVGDINGAASIAFSPAGSQVVVPAVQPPGSAAGLPVYEYGCSGCGVERFGGISRRVADVTTAEIAALRDENISGYEEVLSYMEQENADAVAALDAGYYYTSANTAFLGQVDAALLRDVNISRQSVLTFISNASACVSGLKRPVPTRENLQWVAGGDLRATWAKRKLEETRRSTSMASDSDYESVLALYKEALYAKGWCDVAAEMYTEAGDIGGKAVNESVLAGYARQRVGEAQAAYQEIAGSDEDTNSHLESAQKSLNDSLYAAAVFDADYVIGAVRAENATEGDVNESVAALVGRKGTVLWSALFFAHASYYHALNPRAPGSVLRLGYIADGIENDSLRMDAILQNPETAPTFNPAPGPAQEPTQAELDSALTWLILLLCVLLAASAVLNIILFTSMKGRKERADALVKKPERRKRK